MKNRQLSLGERQVNWSLEKRAIAQTLWTACTTTWKVLIKKETADVLSNRHGTGRPRKTTAVDERNIVRYVKKTPTHQSVTLKTISTGQVWRYLNEPFEEDLESSKLEAIAHDANDSSLVRMWRWDCNLQRSTVMSHRSSGTKSGLMRPRLTSIKVMERPKCRI